MKLYTYYRSSSAYRVRIALNYKRIPYEQCAVNLVKGEQRADEYLARNPQGLVPALETDTGDLLTQSTAIIEWLESTYPDTRRLLPVDDLQRAKVRSLVNIIACDIQPLNNVRVLTYLSDDLLVSAAQKKDWYHHWIELNFTPLEARLADKGYSLGDEISMVDVYLVPQVYNALRFDVDMQKYPNIMRSYEACNTLEEFMAAHPDQQADKPPTG